MFVSLEDAASKLNNSIISFNDSPYQVIGVDGKASDPELVLAPFFPNGTRASALLSAVDFRQLGKRLGYVTYQHGSVDKTEAIFVTRMPMRDSHIGLRNENVYIPPVSNTRPRDITGRTIRLTLGHMMEQPNFINTWRGIFPTVEQAVELLMARPNPESSIGVSAKFAVERRKVGPMYLSYKGSEIGWIDDVRAKFQIPKEYQYLQESLEHFGIPVRLVA